MMNRKQSIMSVLHNSLKQRVDEEKDKVKVPLEYQIKFMAEKAGNEHKSGARIAEVSEDEVSSSDHSSIHDDVKCIKRKEKMQNAVDKAFKAEIRVSYLEAQLEKMETFYQNQIKESGIKMQVRMRKYAHSCLDQVRKQFKDEMLLLHSELEMLKNKEIELTQKCERLLYQEAAHQRELSELKLYAHWDEVAHKQYTEELEKAGVKPEDLVEINEEKAVLKKSFGAQTYYKSILDQGDLEKDAVNLSKPFALYNGTLELGITERLNVLERETVRLFQKKLAHLEQYGVSGSDGNGGMGGKNGQKGTSIVDIMTEDKNRLEKKIVDLEAEMARLQADWKADAERKNAEFARMQAELNAQLNGLRQNAESIKEMFLKELLIKDNIIKNTEGMKDTYYKIAKELKTKLQIPRLHLEFLKTKGTLEHFVSAKITGDDETAKWALLKAGKEEISSIEKSHNDRYYEQRKVDHRKESFQKYNVMSTYSKIANSKRSQTYKDDSNALDESRLDSFNSMDSIGTKRIPMTQGSRRNLNPVFMTTGKDSKMTQKSSQSKIFDINFNDVLRNNSPNVKKTSKKVAQVQQTMSLKINRTQSNRDMFIKDFKPLKSRLSKLDLMAINQHDQLKNLTERSQNKGSIVVRNSTQDIMVEDTIVHPSAAPAPVLDKYQVCAESSLDESAEFTSHPSQSLNDSASRDIMRSTLNQEISAENSKARLIKPPDIRILDQNIQERKQVAAKQHISIAQSKVDSHGSLRKTTIISKDSSGRQLKVVDEALIENTSKKKIEKKKSSLRLSQGHATPQESQRNSQGAKETLNEIGRRMSLHSSENPNPLLDEQFNISFNNQKIQALQQKMDASVFVSESSDGGPAIIRHARVKTFDMETALKKGSVRLSIDSNQFSEIKIKQKKDKQDKYTEDITNQIQQQPHHQGFQNKKFIHSNKKVGGKKQQNQANTSNKVQMIATQKQLQTGRKKDMSDQLQAGGNHLDLLKRINKNHHKKNIACQYSNRKNQEKYRPQEIQESQNEGLGQQYFETTQKNETEETETEETPKSRASRANEQDLNQVSLVSKYQASKPLESFKLKENFTREIIINEGSDIELQLQEQSIDQGGFEIHNTYVKKQIPIGLSQNRSQHTSIITEDSIQDNFYNKPRITGDQTEQENTGTNNTSSLAHSNSHQENNNPVPPLLIPTKDLVRGDGNYAIARRHRYKTNRQNSDIKEIMTKMQKMNQYSSNFQPVIEANEQTQQSPVQASIKRPLKSPKRIGISSEMDRRENPTKSKLNNMNYFSQENTAAKGNFLNPDQLNGELDSGEKLSMIRSTEFNLKQQTAQALYQNSQTKSTGVTRNQSEQKQITKRPSKFHETQRVNNGYFQNNQVSYEEQQTQNFLQSSQGKFPQKKGRLLQTSQMTHRVSSKAMIKGQAITQNYRPKNNQILSQARISQPTNLPSVLSPHEAAFKKQRQSMVFSQGKQVFLHTNITQFPMNVLSSADGKSTNTGGNNELMARKNTQALKLLEHFKTPNTQREYTESKAKIAYQNQAIPPITQKEIEKIQDQIAEASAMDGTPNELHVKDSFRRLPLLHQKEQIDQAQTQNLSQEAFMATKEQSIANSVRQTIPLMENSINSLANSNLAKISQDEFANFQNTGRRSKKQQLASQISKLKEVTSARTGPTSQLKD